MTAEVAHPVSSPSSEPDHGTALRSVARGGSFAAAGSALGAAFGLVLTLVVTHGLTPTSAGQFFSTTAVFIVLQTLLAFGVGAGLVRFVPRYKALDRASDLPTLLRVAVLPVVGAGVAASAGVWLLAPMLAERIGHSHSAPLVSTFHVLALLFLPATLEIAAVECTRAFGDIRGYVLLQQIGVPLLRPILVGMGAALGLPLWAIVLLWLVPLVVALTLAAAIVGRAMRQLLGRNWRRIGSTVTSRQIAREYWAFTAARGTAMVMDSLLTWLDVVLVAAMVSPAKAAIYAAASRFITAGTLVLQALRLTIATDISAALALGQRSRVGEIYRTATQWVVLSSWPLYLVMALFAPTVLRIFGGSYAAGATATAILCAAMMVNLAAGNVGTVLLMGGKSAWVLADKTLCVAVNVGLNLLLIPHYGITGAAIAWAVTICVDSAVSFAQVRWGMGISGPIGGVTLAAVLALGCFGITGLVVRGTLGSSVGALTLTMGLGTGFYAVSLVKTRSAVGLNVLIDALRPRPPHSVP